MPWKPPEKKKDEKDEKKDEAADPTMRASSSSATNLTREQRGSRTRAVSAEKAQDKLKTTEAVAPWLLHDPKSTLSLGDASTVARMQRDEGLSKAEAERKLKWQKDMKKTGVTAGQAAAR